MHPVTLNPSTHRGSAEGRKGPKPVNPDKTLRLLDREPQTDTAPTHAAEEATLHEKRGHAEHRPLVHGCHAVEQFGDNREDLGLPGATRTVSS